MTPARWLTTVILLRIKKPKLYTPEDNSTPTRGNVKVYKSSANRSDCKVFKRLSNAAHKPNEAKTKIRALDVPSRRKSVEYKVDDEDEDDRPKSRSKPKASSSRASTKYIKQVPVSDDKESDDLLPAKDVLRDKPRDKSKCDGVTDKDQTPRQEERSQRRALSEGQEQEWDLNEDPYKTSEDDKKSRKEKWRKEKKRKGKERQVERARMEVI
ncbi:hypothetical protein FRC12_018550 [Ceratobasidium sp. 428]|nr:hypothetical protein FRC12_018550 [Ceratobasidium sp. 428]